MRSRRAYHEAPSEVVADDTAVQDFAFADTVIAGDLDEVAPPSGVLVSDDSGLRLMTPVAYAPPIVEPNPALATRLRLALARARYTWTRVRYGLRVSRDEMNELWSATAEDPRIARADDDPLARAALVGRRMRTFFSFFEWDRADLLRAAWIGLVVFFVVATAGAFALQSDASESASGYPSRSTASKP
ncbi:MAG: hypothetical protein KF850_38355 [Labilithrix sp.]|nr:hypothetical protein [Labilithrix sp.]MBX3217932.1 hypothetical protein [Labilithrix sp.]